MTGGRNIYWTRPSRDANIAWTPCEGRLRRPPPDDHRLPRPLHDGAQGPRGMAHEPDRGAGRHVAVAQARRTSPSATTSCARAWRTPSSGCSASAAPTSRSSPRARWPWPTTSGRRRRAWSGRACATTSSTACARSIPRNFAPVCQLPQSPGVPPASCVPELERCVKELGFVGCNLNPDPSGGHWKDPPLTDRWWYPLYEKLVELDVPAMVHVSASCNPCFHAVGAHYINGDTTAFMQFLTSDLFRDFPTLRVIIPHGGGAVPYHWGRYRGLAQDMGRPPLEELAAEERVLRHLRLPPAGHRPAPQGDSRGEHPLRLRDGGRGARRRPARRASTSTTRSATSTRRPASPPRTARRSTKATRGGSTAA